MRLDEAVLADLCRLSYTEPETRRCSRFDEFDESVDLQSGGACATICRSNRTAIIVVRGTQKNLLNLVMDLQFLWPRKTPAAGRVHRGFLRCADRIESQGLWEWLKAREIDSIWFCGHSLGGAAASVLASRACVFGFDVPINIFTIGQPRVGDGDFANALKRRVRGSGGRIYRVCHPLDPVPRVPPLGLAFLPKYRHAGNACILDGGTLIENATLAERAALTAWQILNNTWSVLTAHSSDKYAANLRTWVEWRLRNNLVPMINIETDS